MILLLAEGCASRPSHTAHPRVVTTVAPMTDLVKQIAGDEIEVWGIIPEGVDSHSFEPSPRDVARISQATAVIMNGLNLELPTKRLSGSTKVRTVELADKALPKSEWIFDQEFPSSGGDPNPHLWTNPIYALSYCDQILEELVRIKPTSERAFKANHGLLTAKIRSLDRAIRLATATVPHGNRRLLTYHDSFPYFAREYGWTVVGAIQPSDFSEPSAKEVSALIEQIKKDRVPAIFGSEVFPSRVLEQIANETGAKYVANLSDDDLPGEPGDPEHTYLGMMRLDVITMVEALGGDASSLASLDVAPIRL